MDRAARRRAARSAGYRRAPGKRGRRPSTRVVTLNDDGLVLNRVLRRKLRRNAPDGDAED